MKCIRFVPLLSVLTVALFLPHPSLPAEEPSLDYYFPFPHDAEFSEAVPTPAEHFGFEVGEWHLRHDQITSYLLRLAEGSERMEAVQYAKSYEDKPLYLLKISHPDNLARTDEIKSRRGAGRRGDASDRPVVAWLGYSIHGNESSGANAVPLVAYFFAAAEGEEIDEWLREMVILIDPVLNPDGLDRFAHWANIHRGKTLVADPNHREHTEGWPTGRFNHYWFDLNRDWLPLIHPESRGRIAKYHEWLPHVLCDFHEMQTSRTFFFQPGVPRRNNPLTLERNYELTNRIAEVNAGILDQMGSLYFTKEVFDDFYAGKGSTYPDLNGSIGILFEQASSRGHLQESPHGDVSFPFTIRNQVAASFGTIRVVAELRDDLIAYQSDFFEQSRREAENFQTGAYVVELSGDAARDHEFIDLARRHQIRLFTLAQDVTVDGESFPAESSVVVPLRQQQYRFIRSFFETRTEFEDQVFYDISAWSMPPAFNLRFAEAPAAEFSDRWLGSEIGEVPSPEGELRSAGEPIAYVVSWESYYAPRTLYRLLSEGLMVKMATKSFTLEDNGRRTRFERGSLVVPVGIQRDRADDIEEILVKSVEKDAARVLGVSRGLAVAGIDLGSPSFADLETPEILLAIGPGIGSTAAGGIWHLLDRRMQMPVSLVEAERLSRIDLSRYNVIILPNGSYSRVSSNGARSLERWLRQGNTLIALQGAATWALRNDLASGELRQFDEEDEDEEKDEEEPVERRPYAEGGQDRQADRITGAIFRAHVDATHPIGFGYPGERVVLFRQGTRFLEPSANPYQTPVLYDEEQARISGYASDENLELLRGSAMATVSFVGSGRTVLFMDDLNFRGYWVGGSKLLANAIFFSSAIQSSGGSGEEEL